MSTPTDPTHPPQPAESRGALRLRMSDDPGRDVLDGGWWPRSRDLAMELVDLADHFPASLGRVTRALVSPPDWDARVRSVPVDGGDVTVESFIRDDTHLIELSTTSQPRLRVLVVPPEFTDDQGEEALLAAATPGNAHAAIDLLETVTEHPDVDPRDHWVANA
jgi:hypothetical protein